jgi:hypothetical protein
MSSSRRVMTGLDNVAIKLFITGNIKFSLIINKPILLFPFKKAILSEM